MPLREPRLELDRQTINTLLGWSGVTMGSICKFIRTVTEASYVKLNQKFVYNRGYVELEDTDRRPRDCWIISIWSDTIENAGDCLFQQPVPIKVRFSD